MDDLHTYLIHRHTMRVGSPLTFSDGERVVAVLSSRLISTPQGTDIDVTMLVEMPGPPKPLELINVPPKERP